MREECNLRHCKLLYEKEQEIFLLKNKLQKLNHEKNIDVMTGTLIRSKGMSKLNKDLESSDCLTIAFIDIDNLKKINDAYGHNIGDRVIVDVSQLVHENIRKEDYIFRFGGDEFVVVFKHIDSVQAQEIWKRIKNKLQLLNTENMYTPSITVSIGFYEYKKKVSPSVNQVIHFADQEMYKMKKKKKEIKKHENII